jgi:hypothetical protein
VKARRVAAAALIGVATLTAGAATALGSAPSGSSLLTRALADAATEHSAHVTLSLRTASGAVADVADVGDSAGTQQIGLAYSTLHVILLGRQAYVRSSNATGLTEFAGWPSKQLAARYAGDWLRYPSSNSAFAKLTAGTTLPSVLAGLRLSGKLSVIGPVPIDNTTSYGVSGRLVSNPAFTNATIYVSVGAKPLPVYLVAIGPDKIEETINIGAWNEKLSVKAPARSLTLPKF